MSKFIEVTNGFGIRYLLNTQQIEIIRPETAEWIKVWAKQNSMCETPTTSITMAGHGQDEPNHYIVETYEQIKAMLM